ncbi:MAG: MOSC N-terminal beta barrel domain-containing protein, partial [Gammaproteobacteria bacterium]
MSSTEQVGTIQSLWRYAVKSMRGEEVDEALVTGGGFLGDRAYALIDQTSGKVVSAKMPKKWSKLVELSASFLEPPHVDAPVPPVRVTWPSGTSVISNEGDFDARLSETLGRPVTLTTARPET